MENIVRQLIRHLVEKTETKLMVYEELEIANSKIGTIDEKQGTCTSLSSKLSRIVIDEKNRIILADYARIEIPIKGCQARCLYILYLMSSNGISNKELREAKTKDSKGYRKALESIFSLINNYKYADPVRACEVIYNLLNRKEGLSDATNKINNALREAIPDPALLKYYVISGQRNGLRQINLSKNHITIQNRKLRIISEILTKHK